MTLREKIGSAPAADDTSIEFEIIIYNEKLEGNQPAATLKKLVEALQKDKKKKWMNIINRAVTTEVFKALQQQIVPL